MKHSSILKDALDIAYEISKLIQYSPKRQERFDRIKGVIRGDFRIVFFFCRNIAEISVSKPLQNTIFQVSKPAKIQELPGASPPGPAGGLTASPRPPAVFCLNLWSHHLLMSSYGPVYMDCYAG